jgi:sigma-B regulation protein RsbU (phosphoserine phosphatase)
LADDAGPLEVLIAEDEPVSLRRLEALLVKWGFSVWTARDGDDAWRLYQERLPPLAILDWLMPGLDGLEVCRRIRSHAAGVSAHVILLSTRSEPGHLVSGLDAGADDYLAKPFHRNELRARLRVGERVIALRRALRRRVAELEEALSQVKQLRGLLPICAYCKKVRDDRDYWHQLETFITEHSEARFSHGVCPECLPRVRAEMRARRGKP